MQAHLFINQISRVMITNPNISRLSHRGSSQPSSNPVKQETVIKWQEKKKSLIFVFEVRRTWSPLPPILQPESNVVAGEVIMEERGRGKAALGFLNIVITCGRIMEE